MKIKIIGIVCLLLVTVASAQTKVGTIDSELIVGLMPETKKVLTRLSEYAKRLDSSVQIKVKEYQDKVAAYQKIEKDLAPDYKKIKVQELAELEKGLQTSQGNANKLIQLKRNELMRPLYKKLGGVIEEVSKANGYTQVLINTGNEFAYIDSAFDITQKVLDKLGIKPPEPQKK